MKNKLVCVVDMEGVYVVYRKDFYKFFMIKDLKKELFIDVVFVLVVCVCIIRDGDILVGLDYLIVSFFGVVWFNLKGECKYFIIYVMDLWLLEMFYWGNGIWVYMVENINIDICFLIED